MIREKLGKNCGSRVTSREALVHGSQRGAPVLGQSSAHLPGYRTCPEPATKLRPNSIPEQVDQALPKYREIALTLLAYDGSGYQGKRLEVARDTLGSFG